MGDRNQRTYYRVDDQALVKPRVLEPDEIEKLERDFDACRLRYSLTAHVCEQRRQREPALRAIRKRNPDVARYLELLETQLETLSLQVVKESDFDQDAMPQTVNLSATGIRFTTAQPIEQGAKLELGIMLFPAERIVMTLADVVRADVEDGGTVVSATFSRIHEEDQETLIRHIHKVQQIQLQRKRAADDAA